MALEAEYLALMPLRITVQPYESMSTDGFGGRSYGDALTFAARYEPVSALTKDSRQRNVVGKGVLIMDIDATDGTRHVCSVSDLITVPDELQVPGVHANPPIIDVQPVYDDSGLHHQVVMI